MPPSSEKISLSTDLSKSECGIYECVYVIFITMLQLYNYER
jgi:hypothetical protein